MQKVYVQLFGREVPGFIVGQDGEVLQIVINNSGNTFRLTQHEFNRFCRYADEDEC